MPLSRFSCLFARAGTVLVLGVLLVIGIMR